MFAGWSLMRGVWDRLVLGDGDLLLLGLGVLRRESRLLLVRAECEKDRLGVERDLLWLCRCRRLRGADCRRVERWVRPCADDLRCCDLLVRRCPDSGVRDRYVRDGL